MVGRSDGIEMVTYDWVNDGENRLIEAAITNLNGTSVSQYIYDAFGNRVASIVDGTRTNYLMAGSLLQVLLEYDASGEVSAKYTYGIKFSKAMIQWGQNFEKQLPDQPEFSNIYTNQIPPEGRVIYAGGDDFLGYCILIINRN